MNTSSLCLSVKKERRCLTKERKKIYRSNLPGGNLFQILSIDRTGQVLVNETKLLGSEVQRGQRFYLFCFVLERAHNSRELNNFRYLIAVVKSDLRLD